MNDRLKPNPPVPIEKHHALDDFDLYLLVKDIRKTIKEIT